MQTFLPYKDFNKSIQCLDYRRLGKQRVEAMQLIKSIDNPNYKWSSHPCSKMWSNYKNALEHYMNLCIDEWISRGYNNTMEKANVDIDTIIYPSWLGDKRLHDSHKSNLLFKDREFYSRYNWKVSLHLPYYWCGYGSTDSKFYGD